VREQAGREVSPTTAIIDSQSAKSAQKGGLCSILQATTRIKRSRADIQDRDGAFEPLRPERRLFPFIEHIFADGGYRGLSPRAREHGN
jgi:hypothetical protein